VNRRKSSESWFNRILAFTAVVVALLTATSCGTASGTVQSGTAQSDTPQSGTPQNKDASGDLFTLRVNTPTSFGAFVAADVLGFFRDEGIQIEYVGVLGKGVTAYQLMEQGLVDFYGGGHPPEVAQARLAGIEVKSVASAICDDPEYNHVRYLVRNDSPIQTLDDIVGYKVATGSIGSCNTGYIQYYLKGKGLDPDGAEFVVMDASGGMEQALLQGLVDVTTSHPPYGTLTLATGEVRQIGSSWDIFQSPGAGVSTVGFLDTFIAEHPDLIQGVVNAMYRARTWINSHQDEAKEIASAYFHLEPEFVSTFAYDANKNIEPSYIEKWFEIAESVGLWESGDILPTDIYTNEFVPADILASDADVKWDGSVHVEF
jgi:ABC-type nitrate/sulfonate/bicarbonate transport system substrate-binding protein